MPALRAAPAGPRALGGDGQKTRVLARDLFDAAARHRTELVHTPFYGVRCVTLQTSAPTRSIHANCGRAAALEAACRSGFEGIVSKQADAPYTGRRSETWLKVKCLARQEFVIIGWTPSTKREGFASLLLGLKEGDQLR